MQTITVGDGNKTERPVKMFKDVLVGEYFLYRDSLYRRTYDHTTISGTEVNAEHVRLAERELISRHTNVTPLSEVHITWYE